MTDPTAQQSPPEPVEYVLAAAQCGPGSPHRVYTVMAGINSQPMRAIMIWANYSLENEGPTRCGRRIETELHKLILVPRGHEDDRVWQYNRVRIYKGTVQIVTPVLPDSFSVAQCRELDSADSFNSLVGKGGIDGYVPIRLRLMSDIGPVPG